MRGVNRNLNQAQVAGGFDPDEHQRNYAMRETFGSPGQSERAREGSVLTKHDGSRWKTGPDGTLHTEHDYNVGKHLPGYHEYTNSWMARHPL